MAVFLFGGLVFADPALAQSWKRIGTVSTLTPNQLCKTDGTNIICDTTTPTIVSGFVGIGTTSPGALIDIGSTGGGTLGTLRLEGNASGYVQLQPAAAAGSWTMTLPTTAGTSGYVLTTNGSGVTSWVAAGSGAQIVLGTSVTVPNPYASATDTQTGFYTAGAGKVDITVSGTKTVEWSSLGEYIAQGSLGIGTATPGSKLDVNGNVAVGYGNGVAAPSNGMAVKGNIGIGTTTANALIDIGSTGGGTLGTLRLEGNTSGYVQLQPAAAAGSWTMTLPTTGGTSGYVLTTNGSGVTSWVAAGSGAQIVLGTSVTVPNPYASASDTQTGFYTAGTGKVDVTSAGTQIAEVNGSGLNVITGAVGIGTTTAGTNAKLAVNGGLTVGTYASNATATSSGNIIASGNVGIGSATPIVSLDLSQKTDALAVPVGTTGTRPTAGNVSNGMLRYNSANGKFEGYQANSWQDILTTAGLGSFIYLGTTSTVPNPEASATDTQTGFYTTGAGKIDVTSAGTQVAEFNSSGLGLGTATLGTNAKLAVNGGLTVGTYASSATATTSGNIITSGSVGIGTATPASSLDINGNAAVGYGNGVAAPTGGLLVSGSVGIGTASPGALVDIGSTGGGTLGTLRLEGNTSGYVQLQPAAAAGSWTMTLPTTGGTSGYVLTTNGSGVTSWVAAGSGAQIVLGTSVTVPNPYASASDTQTGFYTAGTGKVDVTVSGTKTVEWSSLGEYIAQGSLGIGTATPGSKLDVNGNVAVGYGNGVAAPSNGMAVKGNIGVGTTTVNALVDIGSTGGGTLGTLRLEGNTSGYVQLQPAAAAGSWTMTLPTTGGTSGYVLTTNGAGVTSWVAAGSGAQIVLGTSVTVPNPYASASDTQTGFYTAGAGKIDVTSAGTQVAEFNSSGLGLGTATLGTNAKLAVNGGLTVGTYASSATATTSGNIITSGSVGIGTATPASSLDINGNAAVGYGNGVAAPTGGLLVSGSVGIGTTSPIDVLTVVSGDSLNSQNLYITGTGAQGITINTTGTNGNAQAALNYENTAGYALTGLTAASGRILNGSVANQLIFNNRVGPIIFSADSGFTRQDLYIATSGSVGIGTTAPGSKLDINGNAAIGFGNGVAAPSTGLAVKGNIGIGTTTANALIDIGSTGGGTLGTLRLEGNTSGYVQLQPAAAAGSWTMTLPTSGGTSGYVLTTNGSGVTSWVAAGSGAQIILGTSVTVPNPYASASDTQTGFYTAGAGKVDVTSAGTQIAEFNSSGLGLGTATLGTNAKLAVNGGLTVGTYASNATATASGNIIASGSVGIGTTSPQVKLDVNGSVANYTTGTEDEFHLTRQTQGGVSWAQVASFQLGTYNNSGACCGPQSRLDINLKAAGNNTLTGDTNVMTLQSNGNVGIGTAIPAKALHVYSATSGGIMVDGTANPGYQLANSGTPEAALGLATSASSYVPGAAINDVGLQLSNGNNFLVGSGVADYLIVKNGGNVGIGTTVPGSNAKLAVNGGIAVGNYASNATAMTSNNLIVSGNVGIGTSTPNSSLDLSQKTDGTILQTIAASPSATCSSTLKGAIRYNSTLNATEMCNGTTWVLIGMTTCSISVTSSANLVVPSGVTTVYYTLVGGGGGQGGGYNNNGGGGGGCTGIKQNGSLVASASGGNGGQSWTAGASTGASSAGSLSVNAGDTLYVVVGGGGGGGPNANNGTGGGGAGMPGCTGGTGGWGSAGTGGGGGGGGINGGSTGTSGTGGAGGTGGGANGGAGGSGATGGIAGSTGAGGGGWGGGGGGGSQGGGAGNGGSSGGNGSNATSTFNGQGLGGAGAIAGANGAAGYINGFNGTGGGGGAATLVYAAAVCPVSSITTGIISVQNGGTGDSTLNAHGVLVGEGSSAINATATGTSGQLLTSGGASADPGWTTATYPSTIGTSQLLYANGTNSITGLTTTGNGILITDTNGVPSISSTVTVSGSSVGIGTSSPNALIDIGSTGGGTLGTLRLEGNTSGYVQLQPAAAAGSWTMTLPTSAGTSGYVLQTNGSGVTSWVANGAGSQIILGTSVTVPNPYASASDTQTGFYTAGAGKVDVTSAGTQIAEFNSSGLGLGTATLGTNAKLAVNGGLTVGTYASNATATTSGNIIASGSVGIGTASPSYQLDVSGASNSVARFSSTQPVVQITATGATNPATLQFNGTLGSVINSLNSQYIAFQQNGADVVRINGSGHVGIGTVSPQSALDVVGGESIGAYAGANAAPSNGLIVSGNVGIGTAAPGSTLQINGNAAIGYSTSTSAPSNGLQVAGNITIDPVGSSTASPRTFGFSSFNSGQAARLQLPDGSNAIQNAYGDRLQLYSYWGMEIRGSQQNISPPSFDTGVASDASLSVYGTTGNSGNILNLNNNAGTTLDVVTGTGSVGIGTTSPADKLDVNGAIGLTTTATLPVNGFFQSVSGTLSAAAGSTEAARFLQASSGSDYLTLTGGPANSGQIVGPSLGAGGADTNVSIILTPKGNGNVTVNGSAGGSLFMYTNSTSNYMVTKWFQGATEEWETGVDTAQGFYINPNGSSGNAGSSIYFPHNGNVGIGTTSPNALIDIGSTGGGTLGTLRLEGNTSGYVQLQPAAAAGSWTMTLPTSAGTSGYVLQTNGSGVTSWVANGAGSQIILGTSVTVPNPYASASDTQTGFYTAGAGKVDVTIAGSQKAEFNATGVKLAGVIYPLADSTSAIQIDKADGSTNIVTVDSTNSRVGIGTTSPGYALTVYNSQNATTGLQIYNPNAGTSAADAIFFGNNANNTSASISYSSSTATIPNALYIDNGQAAPMIFETGNAEKVRIDAAGNVGIGTTSPAATLDVAGNAVVGFGNGTVAPTGGMQIKGYVELGSSYAPAYPLEIGSPNGYAQDARIGFATSNAASNSRVWSIGEKYGAGATSSPNYGFSIRDESAGVERFAIDWATGNIGIATTSPGALIDIGSTGGGTLGTLRLEGNTSGYVQLQPAAAAGSWTMTLPTTGGTSGYVLTTNGSGVTSWVAAGSGAQIILGTSVTVPNPYASASDTQTGFYTAGAGKIDVTSAGTQVAEFNSSGLGLGTATLGTNAKLAVSGGATFGTYASSATATSSGNIITSGSVGIGTASPYAKLDINGTAGAQGDNGFIDIEDTSRNGMSIGYDTTNNWTWLYSRSVGTAARPLAFFTNNTSSSSPQLYVNASGYVGIGLTNPGLVSGSTNYLTIKNSGGNNTGPASLELAAPSNFQLQAVGQTSFIDTYGGNVFELGRIDAAIDTWTDQGDMRFYVHPHGGNTTEAMHILYNGNIGIGTTSPAAPLTVASGSASMQVTPGWFSGTGTWINLDTSGPSGIGSGGAGANPWVAYVASASNWFSGSAVGDIAYRNTGGRLLFGTSTGSPTMVISGSNVGIGTSSPNALIDIGSTGGGTLGTLRLEGNTSGYVQLQPAAAAGSWTMTLPTSAGTSGYVLQTNGSGVTSWVANGAGSQIILGTSVTVPNPYASASDTQTGFYTAGAGKVDVTSAGTQIAEFNSSGLGLGTATLGTNAKLAVNGGLTVGTYASNATATTSGNIIASGSVGIGTASPSYQLDVSGASNSVARFSSTQPVVQITATGATNSATLQFNGTLGSVINSLNSQYIAFQQNGADVVRINGSGHVGIGTVSPQSALDVVGGESIGAYAGANAAPSNGLIVSGNVGIGTAAPGSKLDVNGNAAIGYGNGVAAPSNGMIVSGNVGIGTTSPNALIDIGSTGGGTLGTLRLEGSTSGYVQLQPAAAAGSWTMTLPTTAGTSGYVLQTNGSGVTSWVANGAGSQIILGTSVTVPNPYASASDTQTGFYTAGAGKVDVTIAGSQKAEFNATGVKLAGVIYPLADSTSAIQIDKADGSTNIMTVDSTNSRVGIGTAAPAYALDVQANSSPVPMVNIRQQNVAGIAGFNFADSSNVNQATLGWINSSFIIGSLDSSFYLASNGPILINSNSTNSLQITTSGNIGLGTTTPKSKLDVSGAVAVGSYSGIIAAPTNGLIVSGSVGIGTSSPNALIDIGSTGGGTLGTLRLEGNTSGYVQLQPAAAAGSWTMTLPTTAGTSGYVLQTNGSGVTSWVANGAGSQIILGTSVTVPNPYASASDTQTGFYTAGAGKVDVTSAGTQVAEFNSSGLGLGTATLGTNAKLAVNGGLTVGTYASNATATTSGNIIVSGSVGIGTTLPGSTLQINGNAAIGYSTPTAAPSNGLQVAGNLTIDPTGSTTSSPKLFGFSTFSLGQAMRLQLPDTYNAIQNAWGDRLQMYSYWGMEVHGSTLNNTSALGYSAGTFNDTALTVFGGSGNTYPAFTVVNNAGTSTWLTVAGNGSVGIGTTSPSGTFQIGSPAPDTNFTGNNPVFVANGNGRNTLAGIFSGNNSDYVYFALGRAGNEDFEFGVAGAAGQFFSTAAQGDGIFKGNWSSSNNLLFGSGSSAEAMRITPTNNIGIGTTAPGNKLDVNGAVSVGYGTGVAAPSNGEIIQGNVGIGTASPTDKLDVAGGLGFTATTATLPANGIYLSAANTLDVTNSGVKALEIGQNYLNFITTGTSVPQIEINGQNALSSFTLANGGGNLFVGAEQNLQGFTGSESVFIGDRAGGNFTTGSFNVAVGHNACGIGAGTAVAAYSMTCLGTDAGRNVATTASNDILIGSGIGMNVSSNLNVLVAGGSNNFTSATQDALIGYGAGSTVTTGSGLVIIGNNADVTSGTAYGSVIIGADANGGQRGAVGGGQSVIIGDQAGNSSLTGTGNTIIGRQVASTTLTTGSNNILIGTSSAVDATTSSTSNFLNIGNTLYGNLSNGSVGIGTTAPVTMLQVGNGGATGKIAVYSQDNSGGQLEVLNSTTTGEASIGFYQGPITPKPDGFDAGTFWAMGPGTWGTGNAFNIGYNSVHNILTMTTSGNVGIGTTTVNALLDVGSTASTLGTLRLEGSTSGYVQLQPAAAAGSWTMTLPATAGTSGYYLQTNGAGVTSWAAIAAAAQLALGTSVTVPNPYGSATDTQTGFYTAGSGKVDVTISGTQKAEFNSGGFNVLSGNVGIGTSSPGASLNVNATASSGAGIFLSDSDYTGNAGSPYIRVQGTRLDGNTSQAFAGGLALEHVYIGSSTGTNSALGTIYFGGNYSSSAMTYAASISGKAESTFTSTTNAPSALVFYTGSIGTSLATANTTFGTEHMRLTSGGYLGIGSGVSSPTALLDVENNSASLPLAIKFSNNYNSSYPSTAFGGGLGVNFSGGSGEIDFWNQYPSAAEAYRFYTLTGTGTANVLLTIGTSGGVAIGTTYAQGAIPPVNSLVVQGSVGIGTASPTATLLDVENTAGCCNNTAIFANTSSFGSISVNSGGNAPSYLALQSVGNSAWIMGDMGSNTSLYFIPSNNINGSPNVVFANNGSVGIGTTSPQVKLDVNGSVANYTTGTEDEFHLTRQTQGGVSWAQVASFQLGTYNNSGACCGPQSRLDINLKAAGNNTLTGDTNVMTLQSNGNVGIGTASPQNLLDVNGAASVGYNVAAPSNGLIVNGEVGIGTSSPDYRRKVDIAADMTLSGNNNGQLKLIGVTNPNKGLLLGYDTTNNNGFIQAGTAGSSFDPLSINPAGGNVGIGTTSPGAKLDIAGGNMQDNGTIRVTGIDNGGAFASGKGVELRYDTGSNDRGSILTYDRSGAVFKNIDITAASIYLLPQGTGSVAIGTTSSVAKLTISAADSAGAINVVNSSGANRFALNPLASGGWTFYDNGTGSWTAGITQLSGNVGIGTTAPNGMLEVYGGHLLASRGGTAPSISSCGGSGSSVTGTDNSFKVTTGSTQISGASACTVNFGSTWATAPNACVLTAANQAAMGQPGFYVASISTTQIVFGFSTTLGNDQAGAAFYVICM